MKASELRIGNFVSISSYDALVKIPSLPVKVTGIISSEEIEFEGSTTGGKKVHVSVSHCTGIPLCEECLRKFGFVIVWDRKCNYRAVLGDFELCCGDALECYNFITLKNLHSENEIKVELQYVHQLQNLYYVLTGKELETVAAAAAED